MFKKLFKGIIWFAVAWSFLELCSLLMFSNLVGRPFDRQETAAECQQRWKTRTERANPEKLFRRTAPR